MWISDNWTFPVTRRSIKDFSSGTEYGGGIVVAVPTAWCVFQLSDYGRLPGMAMDKVLVSMERKGVALFFC
jgi:hypothetical protein